PYVLETALSKLNFYKKKDRKKFEKNLKKRFTQILIQRSKINTPVKQSFDAIPRPEPPHSGHGDKSFEFSYGTNPAGSFGGLAFRPGLHDFMALDNGQPLYSTIEFLSLKMRTYFDTKKLDKKIQLDELLLLKLSSLFPSTSLDQKISYELDTRFSTLNELSCYSCRAFKLAVKAGWSTELLPGRLLFFGLIGPRFEAHSLFARGYRYGPEAKSGLHLRGPRYRLLLEVLAFWDLDQVKRDKLQYQYHLSQSYTLKANWELRMDLSYYFPKAERPNKSDFNAGLRYYF
ncbi:MAG: hypothetical protein HOM21_03015, partial [Halobacteriovoraceae bacterium]|nr:hypothetical protein [Halobacteriovoraceae bacterium]